MGRSEQLIEFGRELDNASRGLCNGLVHEALAVMLKLSQLCPEVPHGQLLVANSQLAAASGLPATSVMPPLMITLYFRRLASVAVGLIVTVLVDAE